MHVCVNELGQDWFSQWLVAWSAQTGSIENDALLLIVL